MRSPQLVWSVAGRQRRVGSLSALIPGASSERTKVYCRCAGDRFGSSAVQVAGGRQRYKRLGGLRVLLDGALLLEEELSRDVPASVVGEFRERPMICWRLRTGLNSCLTKWSSREQEVPF
jgi:hypothetical protein